MNYLSVENISKSYGERILFQDLFFGLSKGDKMALIANNGTGKSSMLKIIAGKDVTESGKITLRNGIRIGYLEQDPLFNEGFTVKEFLENSNSDVMQIIRDYDKALELQTDDFNDATSQRFQEASDLMDKANAWNFNNELNQILTRFKILDLTQNLKDLSGGQRKRLSLALLILDKPELLLLDEPTNHLDIEMIEWLEEYLKNQNITLLMITHDRYFLDRVCNHILELEDGKLYHHKGNYSYFLLKREEREENFNTEISKAGRLMKKELEWIRKTPQARTTKSKARVDNFDNIKQKANSKKVKQELKLEVKMSRVGGKILELKKVYKSYGDLKILSGFDYVFKNGERIGIIGDNGVGKSTFLNIITRREEADSGKINIGETIVYGYFNQKGIVLKEDKRVIEVLKDIADVIVMANGSKISASQLLEHFMFDAQMQYTYVSKLSGGEKRRLYLLTVLMKNPNFLILDEPTNDLDLLTLNKLEEFLLEFKGCLILVSHDRYFMDKLTDHLFVFKGAGVVEDHYCSYSELRNKQIKELKTNKKEEKGNKLKTKDTITFTEKKEYKSLEKQISKLELEKSNLEASFKDTTMDYELMMKKSKELEGLTNTIDSKMLRWMELEDKME
ncbi:ABC-F family ATP-binding cassette domain-containing protein [Flavobacteriales bacterium]|jgi:ATP-binding cassette subfamily F protein uup|nr:ABC-F family ATP-binding cassette domain-containing protein [Flavobacteriales bacterium]